MGCREKKNYDQKNMNIFKMKTWSHFSQFWMLFDAQPIKDRTDPLTQVTHV